MTRKIFPEGTKTKIIREKGPYRLTHYEHKRIKENISNGNKRGLFNIKNRRCIFVFENGVFLVTISDRDGIREFRYRLLKVEDEEIQSI